MSQEDNLLVWPVMRNKQLFISALVLRVKLFISSVLISALKGVIFLKPRETQSKCI